MVVWIIGLPGAGKTTLAAHVVRRLRDSNLKVAHMDGDEFRDMMGGDLGYGDQDRKLNARRMRNVSLWLSSNQIHAVCSINSLFEEDRIWCRKYIEDFYLVHVQCSDAVLWSRNQKNLYASGEVETIRSAFENPSDSDFNFSNIGDTGDLFEFGDGLVYELTKVI